MKNFHPQNKIIVNCQFCDWRVINVKISKFLQVSKSIFPIFISSTFILADILKFLNWMINHKYLSEVQSEVEFESVTLANDPQMTNAMNDLL
jgi:hypothetical protein